MIQVVQRGSYRLIETKEQTKILLFDNQHAFIWVNTAIIGEILPAAYAAAFNGCILAEGHYRLYLVKNERHLTGQLHLELYVGNGRWQGYLLTTGLPSDPKKGSKMIPTKEIITVQKMSEYQGATWL